MVIRPHAVSFLAWCRRRGHRLAIWTAAHSSWADSVVRKLCPLVQNEIAVFNDLTTCTTTSSSTNYNNDAKEKIHTCPGISCRATFDFVWGGDQMRKLPRRNNTTTIQKRQKPEGCHWCEFYSQSCRICQCFAGVNYCPCRHVKDLRLIWWKKSKSIPGNNNGIYNAQSSAFSKERTLMVENSPQFCRYNYGNAIYVPTYRGGPDDEIFKHLQSFIKQRLESSTSSTDKSIQNVRTVRKCNHPPGPHACSEQLWWPSSSTNTT